MAFTQNFNSNTSGPVHWELMGPIADRPATADLHTTYLSTDEGNGVLKAYLYTESGWMQMQGIEGFTGGGSGGGGVLLVTYDSDAGHANVTFKEAWDAVLAGQNVVFGSNLNSEGAENAKLEPLRSIERSGFYAVFGDTSLIADDENGYFYFAD